MEAHGALETVTYLHQKHNVVMEYIVMDDDSSSENILQWDYYAAIKEELMHAYPRTAGGGYITADRAMENLFYTQRFNIEFL
jgi:hypothetical protein